MKLGIKDKIFLGIAVLGLFIFIYEKITGEKDGSDVRERHNVVEEELGAISQGEDQKNQDLKEAEIVIGGKKMIVWLADSEETRYRGLSNVGELGSKSGMLFIHPEPGFHSYVMRQMKFDLDFVFIFGDEVVDIQEWISRDRVASIKGDSAYDKVLELPAGTVEDIGILVGEKIVMPDLPK